MSKAAGRQTTVLVADRNLSSFFSAADSTAEVAALETTGMGGAEGREYIPGLGGGAASLQGFSDFAADVVEQALHEALGSPFGQAVTIGQRGLAVGAGVRVLLARHTRVAVTSPVDGVVGISADIQSTDEGVRSGHALHDLEAEVASGQEAAVDNGVASAGGGSAHLHVTTADDDGGEDTLGVRVEGSATGLFTGEQTTLVTFSTVEGSPWSEHIAVTGAIPRYLRAVWEKTVGGGGGSGAWTFAVAFGRG